MISLLKRLFLDNWPRKLLSLLLAIGTWFAVNQSLTTTKTISNIPVRVMNIPPGKTVEGLQANDVLSKRITVTLSGNKSLLEELSSNDLEIIVDASNRRGRWIETISKKNLHALNPALNISQGVTKISHKNISIELTKLVTEKIPITITQPIGEAPKGYRFLDIWPYQLFITISGPENTVKKLKTRGVKLTFNLSDISKAELDDLSTESYRNERDVVSFFVPNEWKRVTLPDLYAGPIEINDPSAKYLRIDFVRNELIPIVNPLPVSLFFPTSTAALINPQKMTISNAGNIIESRYGLKLIAKPLYASGVSALFVEIMRDVMEIQVLVVPKSEERTLDWSLQFVNHRALEDKFVSMLLSDVSDEELHDLRPQIREEYLRNRFRNYMNRLQLFVAEKIPLRIEVKQQGNAVIINEKKE